MTHRRSSESIATSLGTLFVHDVNRDVVAVEPPEGGEFEVPAPDLRELLQHWNEKDATEGVYDAAFENAQAGLSAMETQVSSERREAGVLLAMLLEPGPGHRAARIDQGSPYCTYEVAMLALEASRRAVHEDPLCALRLAEAGRKVAEQLSPTRYGSERVAELRAFSDAVCGNALRVSGDLRAAVKAFQEARLRLGATPGVSLEAIEVDNLETSLRRDLRDFGTALELSARVVAAYRGLGLSHRAVAALLKRAVLYENMGEFESAISVLQEAAQGLDTNDRWTTLIVRHSLVCDLARVGRSDVAAELFGEIQELYGEFASPAVTARRDWAEGFIKLGQGHLEESGSAFSRARDLLLCSGYPVEAALASLDLATALGEQGRYAEVRDLAAATYALLESQGVHRDALAALAQFQQAAARERLDREVLRQIAQRLSRAAELRPLPA